MYRLLALAQVVIDLADIVRLVQVSYLIKPTNAYRASMSVIITGISIEAELLHEFDRSRGDVPRSRLIQRLIERYLREERGGG